ncbi:MAG: hypothetical protein AB8B65_01445 [Kordia sp.]|uniref:hypothetical protein n=1 Tax=Kordia sp. TaxID=1965332 RepID=UPI003858DB58
MKKQSRKISLKKVVISKINLLDMHNIKGGSSVPTDGDTPTEIDDKTRFENCPSHSY